MAECAKIVVVTQKTALEELVERHNSRAQAAFRLQHAGVRFDEYQGAHDAYTAALNQLKQAIPAGVRHQQIERSFLPNLVFGDGDVVLALGRDGLVVNIAKYLTGQLLLGFNPDPDRVDGVLVCLPMARAGEILRQALAGAVATRNITMAQASLADGQTLYAVNDLFIGQQTHLSARYRLRYLSDEEDQSSSGIIVSTGAGSTGWLRSILTGAAGVLEAFRPGPLAQTVRENYAIDWDADHLVFSVREPFTSKTSQSRLIHGKIQAGQELTVTSQMPQRGVIFSDGVEVDYLEFNSGQVASIGVAERKVRLVVA